MKEKLKNLLSDNIFFCKSDLEDEWLFRYAFSAWYVSRKPHEFVWGVLGGVVESIFVIFVLIVLYVLVDSIFLFHHALEKYLASGG